MTRKDLHSITRTAQHLCISIHVWVAVPCTAGCSWANVNRAKGVETGDAELTDKSIEVAIGVAKHVHTAGGDYSLGVAQDIVALEA